MLLNKKFIGICVLLVAIFVTFTVGAKYIPNNKDTKLPPEKLDPSFLIKDTTNFVKLYENTNYIYYYKESRDILAIYDRRNDYLWKTGADIESQEIGEEICFATPRKQRKENGCTPIEQDMNFKFAAIANSLVTIEYFDRTKSPVKVSSSLFDPSLDDNPDNIIPPYVESELQKVADSDNHYILDVKFLGDPVPQIFLKVHIYFTEKGVSYEIRNEEISGKDRNKLISIWLTPFLGASGGGEKVYNPDDDDFTIIRNKYRIPGYALVPDGSGALIRFTDYETTKSLSAYRGTVFGRDYSQFGTYDRVEFRYVPVKQPTMPVFGIAHGNDEAAFVAYATSGAEQMEILVTPDEGENMKYHFAYPKFVYNYKYYQIYDQQGRSFEELHKNLNNFDIKMNYEFLAGDGITDREPVLGTTDGLPANYVGMAKAYRNYLLSENILTNMNYTYNHVPTRLDFIMSDVKKTVVGYEDVVVTKIKDVERILKELQLEGVTNINSGLLGYQDGGVTLAKPNNIDYNSEVGTKREFEKVIDNLKSLGIDVSLTQDFVKINSEQMSLSGNTTRHISNWYTTLRTFDAEATVNTYNYARANKTEQWVEDYLDDLKDLNPDSFTVEGIQNILLTDYARRETVTRAETIDIYQDILKSISKDYTINASNPNQYTWKYIDRFLDAPVFNSQYIIQTDTVPFLQLVLNGSMELYAPYSNFSFYTDSDVLRMIDYNVYPSFILSQEPAYLLMSTNSSNYYSTEYSEYKNLIQSIYGRVDSALSSVLNSEWENRRVIQDGVIVNSYSNGIEIVINYTSDSVTYNNVVVEPLTHKIIEKE